MLFFLLTAVNAMYQNQAGLHDWSLRLFGELKSVSVKGQMIFYESEHNGVINRGDGQVVSRNDYIKCDNTNYVNYDKNQKVVQLYADGYSVLLNQEMKEEILYCLRGEFAEYVLITPKLVYSIGEVNFTQGNSYPILYAGQTGDYISMLVEFEGQTCIHKITQAVWRDYCVNGVGQYKQFGQFIYMKTEQKVFIKYNQTYILKESFPVDITSLGDIVQFLGDVQRFVVLRNNDKKYIVDEKNNIDLEIAVDDVVVQNVNSDKYYFILSKKDKNIRVQQFDRESKESTYHNVELLDTASIASVFMIELYRRQILIQFSDLETVLIQGEQVLWKTQQSLIDIQSIFFEKYENAETSHKNQYYESLEKHGAKNPLYVIPNLLNRIYYEVMDFHEEIIHHLTQFGKDRENEIDSFYGLKQKVYFLTSNNIIVCYDTQTKVQLSKFTLKNLDSSFKLIAHHQIESNLMQKKDGNNVNISPAHVFFYYSQEKQRLHTYMLDLNIQMLQQVAGQQSSPIIWTFPYRVVNSDSTHPNIVVLIDDEENIFTYPKYDQLSTKEILLYREHNGMIYGYKLLQKNLQQLWTINVVDQLLHIKSSYHPQEENPRVAIWDDKKVLFKLIDHSNFAILTTDGDQLKLLIVNAKTGKIIFQSSQNDVDFEQSIDMVFDEHQVFVTYYNKVQMNYEIWTVEIYHAKIEVSFIKMLENYFFTNTELIMNYYKSDLQAFFLQQVYGYPLGIQSLTISKTLKSLTKKNLIIVTTNGQIHSLDRNLLSARRREKADQQVLEYSLQSAELPPYQYLLPINYMNMLSYNQQLKLNKFVIESTNLESSSLMIVYGQDIFCTRIAPDKTYDMLQDDFNYVSLIGTMLLIFVGTKIFSKMARSSKQLKQFYH